MEAIPSLSPAADVDAMLAQMAAGASTALDRATGPFSNQSIAKVRYSHKAMADLIIESPWISQNQLAAHFGYSPSWVSTMLASDAFQSYLAARQEELVDPTLRLTLQERARALLEQSFRVLQEKISKPADQVPDMLALRAGEMAGKLLGMGTAPPPAPPPAPGAHLSQLAERLAMLGVSTPTEVVDVQARQVAA
ncbi:MAG: hypothetical protein E6Q97_36000 [Desulfurellales bacterium]|nr:MAG: hypothetical protein E6Q97_36000 [Desulfurellales bacterium]